jgi:hypothetical protein
MTIRIDPPWNVIQASIVCATYIQTIPKLTYSTEEMNIDKGITKNRKNEECKGHKLIQYFNINNKIIKLGIREIIGIIMWKE